VRLPSGGSGCEPYGGFRSVFAHWVGGYQASLESSAANPLVKNYKHLPSRYVHLKDAMQQSLRDCGRPGRANAASHAGNTRVGRSQVIQQPERDSLRCR
jgi:hypothetical protein